MTLLAQVWRDLAYLARHARRVVTLHRDDHGRAETLAVLTVLVALFLALLGASAVGERLRCERLRAAHSSNAATYCGGAR